MGCSKKKGVESLEDIILLFVHYIWEDFIQIVVYDLNEETQCAEQTLPPQGVYLNHKDIEELEKELKWLFAYIDVVDAVRRAFFGTIPRTARLLHISVAESSDTSLHTPALVSEHQTVVDHNHKSNERHITGGVVILTLVITYLQCMSSNWASSQRVQQVMATYIEIEYEGQNPLQYRMIDTSLLDICGVHFAKNLNLYRWEAPRRVRRDDSHNVKSIYSTDIKIDVGNSTDLFRTQDVFVSNVTTTDTGLQFSAEDLAYLLTVFNLIVGVVVLTPAMIETAPIRKDSVGQVASRAINTLKSLVVELSGSPNTGYCANMIFGGSTDQQEVRVKFN